MTAFEIATRKKYRFPFRGLISTEDLWDLSMKDLDSIYKVLTKEAKSKDDGDSLLTEAKPDPDLILKIEIVREVFETKQNEANEAKAAAEKAKKKEQLLALLDRKENASLEAKSEDEIRKMIAELG